MNSYDVKSYVFSVKFNYITVGYGILVTANGFYNLS